MEDNLVFFLYEDNSIGYIKKNAIKEKNLKKYCKEKEVRYLMVPSGIFTPTYILLDQRYLPTKKFKKFEISYILDASCVDYIDNAFREIYSKDKYGSRNRLVIDNYFDFIKFIFSMIRLQVFNHIYNSLSKTFSLGINGRNLFLRDVRIKGEDFELTEDSVVIKKSDIITILAKASDMDYNTLMSQMFTVNEFSSGTDHRLTLKLGNMMTWKKKKIKDIEPTEMIAVHMQKFGTVVLVAQQDYVLLDNYKGMNIFLNFDCKGGIKNTTFDELVTNLNLEEPLSEDVILSNQDFFFVKDRCVDILMTRNDIIECATEMKYIQMAYQTLLDITYDEECKGLISEIQIYQEPETGLILEPFVFGINNIEDDSPDSPDTLTLFFEEFKKFLNYFG